MTFYLNTCRWLLLLVFLFQSTTGTGQTYYELQGQVSAISSYSPDNSLPGFAGVRYIPKFDWERVVDSTSQKKISFETSLNVWGTSLFSLFDEFQTDANILPSG